MQKPKTFRHLAANCLFCLRNFSPTQQQQINAQMPQPMIVKQEYPKQDYSYRNMEQQEPNAFGGVQVNYFRIFFSFFAL